MSKYSQISDNLTKSSFIDFSPIPNISPELKISNNYSINAPNYMQNIFTNKFNKFVATTQSVVEDNYSQGLKYKSCILLKDNITPRDKTVKFSESTIHITKPEQKSVYPSSNELYTYVKSDNYSEEYHNFLLEVTNTDLDNNLDKNLNKNSEDYLLDSVVESINTDLDKKSDIIGDKKSDIIGDKKSDIIGDKKSDIIEDKTSDINVEETIIKKYNIICNCFSFFFKK